MKKRTASFFLLCCVLAAAGSDVFGKVFDVEFIRIGEGIWVHRSYAMYAGYKTPSNGLILETNKSAVLIDTAWNDEETGQILDFVKTRIKKPVSACLITHSHQDRAGGLKTIFENGTAIYMTDLTHDLLKKNGIDYGYIPLKNGALILDNLEFDLEYRGPSHSPDTIAVWLPEKKLLFGGCLIKSLDTKTIGNTDDADLKNWPVVIGWLIEKHRDASTVVPGHGAIGGTMLLKHTLALLNGK